MRVDLPSTDGDLQNGRKACPECGNRNTEKTRPYSYECHTSGCEHEWTDTEQRQKDREARKRRRKKHNQLRYI